MCCPRDATGWTCVKLVRDPFDRLVSSYLRTAMHTEGFEEMRRSGSFLDFEGASRKKPSSWGTD